VKLLELGMRLYNSDIDESAGIPFFPTSWTTALALYTRAAFPGLEQVIQKYNSPKMFYKENPAVAGFLYSLRFATEDCEFKLKENVVYSRDTALKTGSGWKKEVFFAMRLGYAIEGVPSEHVHILQKFLTSGNLYSNLPALYPAPQYSELTSGHIKNPINLISDILNVDFTPLGMDRLYVPSYTCGSGAMEVYLPAEDKVAVFPDALVKMLTTQDIFAITLKNNILCLNNKPLHELCGKFGVYWKGALNLFDAN